MKKLEKKYTGQKGPGKELEFPDPAVSI